MKLEEGVPKLKEEEEEGEEEWLDFRGRKMSLRRGTTE